MTRTCAPARCSSSSAALALPSMYRTRSALQSSNGAAIVLTLPYSPFEYGAVAPANGYYGPGASPARRHTAEGGSRVMRRVMLFGSMSLVHHTGVTSK